MLRWQILYSETIQSLSTVIVHPCLLLLLKIEERNSYENLTNDYHANITRNSCRFRVTQEATQ